MKYFAFVYADIACLAPDARTRCKVGKKVYVLWRRQKLAPFLVWRVV